jgi:hypothetical protein
MPNYYNTTSGERVSQATIDRRRSETYRELYEGEPHPLCAGCSCRAQGTAHLVPQKVCKDEGKTEYCWLPVNMVPACHRCNSKMESYKGEEVKALLCYEKLLDVTKLISTTRYNLMTND